MKIRVTKDFNFEMGHALDFHNGKCKHLHGHTYHLSVTILGEPNSDSNQTDSGMVMDFTDLKQIVKSNIIDLYDHSMVLHKDSKYLTNVDSWPNKERLHLKYFQPTCENLLHEFVEILQPYFKDDIILVKVLLQETTTSYAEWLFEDQ
jgi:6-pyruvoyltetrahydropterin/6-carboxytetrahydropterin synthase